MRWMILFLNSVHVCDGVWQILVRKEQYFLTSQINSFYKTISAEEKIFNSLGNINNEAKLIFKI